MPTQIGYIDSNGHPILTVRISGTNPGVVADVEAMIDTGFTGFMMLPYAKAVPLGLILLSTGSYQLADGKTITRFLAKGSVTILTPSQPSGVGTQTALANLLQSETVEGLIVLDPSGSILLGMEFLKSLNKWLVLGSVVMLLDQDAVQVPQLPAPPPPPPQT